METHVYNEQKKCFDPIDNRCMCCGKGFSHGENDNFYIRLYKPKDWKNTLLYRSVEYHWINIGVARCANCKRIQKKAILYSLLYALGIGLGIAIIGVVMVFALDMRTLGMAVIVLGIIASILLGLSKSVDREAEYLEKKGVLSKEHAVQEYEEVAKLVREGWSFEEPSPEE